MKSRRIFFLGNQYLVFYLSFLSAFAPLSTDMYLPALPGMAQTLHTSNEMAGLTISIFLFLFGFSMLVWGPLSDKYGRKPILMAGSAIFVVSSIAIALANSIEGLLFWRFTQAIGAGAASSVSLTIVKDVLRGSLMEKIVAWMQAVTLLAPMLAPVLGGGLLLFVSWRGIFWCLAFCGLLAFIGAFALKETGSCKNSLSLAATFARMGHVLANRNFRQPLIIFSAMAMPFMSYLAVSSFIFQNQFQLSPQSYSLFFAFNALFSIGGPIAHMAILRFYRRDNLILWQIFIMFMAGAAIILLGDKGAWPFALLFASLSFCGSAIRAPSTVLMMESIKGDNGVVTSLINFGGLFFGTISMIIASFSFWPNPVLAVGCIAAIVSGICALCWLKIKNRY